MKRHRRSANDWYIEPRWAVDLFVREAAPWMKASHAGVWLDPCCGSGQIPRGLVEAGIAAVASDLRPPKRAADTVPAFDFAGSQDFMERRERIDGSIMFNPPYSRAQAFVEHALSLCTGYVVAILPLSFLAADRRHGFWTTPPTRPWRIWLLSSRPSMPPGARATKGTIKARGGFVDYCWVAWRAFGPAGETETRWLRLPPGLLKTQRQELWKSLDALEVEAGLQGELFGKRRRS